MGGQEKLMGSEHRFSELNSNKRRREDCRDAWDRRRACSVHQDRRLFGHGERKRGKHHCLFSVMVDKVPSHLRRRLPSWNQGSTSEGEVDGVGVVGELPVESLMGFGWLAGYVCVHGLWSMGKMSGFLMDGLGRILDCYVDDMLRQ